MKIFYNGVCSIIGYSYKIYLSVNKSLIINYGFLCEFFFCEIWFSYMVSGKELGIDVLNDYKFGDCEIVY